MARGAGGSRHIAPFTLSAILHAAVATLLFNTLKERKPVALPPMYRVNIVAAPPGERAIGEVKSGQTKAATPVTQPSAAQSTLKEMPLPKAKPAQKTPARATPSAPKPAAKAGAADAKAVPQPRTEAPKAGGGPVGGKGTDVATVRTDGIEFAFPGYLNNIVRQIALNFKPRNTNAGLKAEIRFLIHRDGSVSDLTFIRRSGNFSFDLEAQGAVEAASSARRFGSLPDGFADDVLPVVFSFDPQFLK
ncbi:MAG TPA: TonB C-terminal domain-containing protein [Gemmatimonadaceae bacterium]|jgi:outer membrane biosynthesis protein TonB|nr:TonB C-terminal domain-containing protein [Gemmatimonadaceae bacterium]